MPDDNPPDITWNCWYSYFRGDNKRGKWHAWDGVNQVYLCGVPSPGPLIVVEVKYKRPKTKAIVCQKCAAKL